MDDNGKEKINIKSLNRCIKEYRKLGHILNFLVMISIVAVVIYVLNKLKIFVFIGSFLKLLIPLFVGVVLAWLFSPLIDRLNKKFPKILSCIIVYVGVILLIFLILALVIPNLMSQVGELISSWPSIYDGIKELLAKYIGSSDVEANVIGTIESFSSNFIETLPDKVIVTTRSFISGAVDILLGLMISFYLSYDYHKFTRGVYKLVPEKYRKDTKDLISRINQSLRNYVEGVLIVMLLVFISGAIGLSIAGLKAPLIFALFCAITDIIPYFGPWIGAIPAVIVALTISPVVAIFTVIAIVIVQTLENNFYQPLIMSHAMKLHPVVIMLGLLIFGHYFGIVGMILATPVISTFKIIYVFVDEKINIVERVSNLISQFE